MTVLQGGQLSGAGGIGDGGDPDLINSGAVTPGDAILAAISGAANPNALKVDGDFTNFATGALQINVAAIADPVGRAIAGDAYGAYGSLAAADLVTLDGTLDLNMLPGDLYDWPVGETTIYDVLSFGALAQGTDFASLEYNGDACALVHKDLYACGVDITIAEDFRTDPGQLNLDIRSGSAPEPSTQAMLGCGLMGLLGFGFLRRRLA